MRPDRIEVMTSVGDGAMKEISPGVVFDCLVGSHNQARQLTTGIVTFAPGAVLPYHMHVFTESITLLSGTFTLDVEGRRYSLKKLDNAVIRAGKAHAARNTSTTRNAVLRIAMARSMRTSRTLVDRFFSQRSMPDTPPVFEGPNVLIDLRQPREVRPGRIREFIDCFNADLMPGLEMSGG